MTGTRWVLRAWLALVAIVGILAVSGCGRTVSGTAVPAGEAAAESVNTRIDKLLRECEAVALPQIAETVQARVAPSFYGAVCMWDIVGGAVGDGMVTLNWYENATLMNEKANNDRLGYQTTGITVQGRRGIQTRRPNDLDSCGVSAGAADTGIIGWWVNYPPGGAHPDPCAAATKLLELTLNLAR